MTELAIKNKWISFGESSTVQDMQGHDVLKVKGKVFTFTSKKLIIDMNENLRYMVRRQFFYLFRRKARIYDKDNNQVALVSRKVFSFHDRYFVTSNLGEMEIIGNILQFDYKIILNGKEIGHIARKISLRDSFVLTIEDDFDASLFVAFVIAIDIITDHRDSENSSISFGSGD